MCSARLITFWPSSLLQQTATNLLRQIPIGAVQALLAVDALDKNPVAHFFLHAPVLDSLITAILPSALLGSPPMSLLVHDACAESALPVQKAPCLCRKRLA